MLPPRPEKSPFMVTPAAAPRIGARTRPRGCHEGYQGGVKFRYLRPLHLSPLEGSGACWNAVTPPERRRNAAAFDPPPCRSPAGGGERSVRLEVHRHPVDALALVGRRRTVREDVAEMAAAAAAIHLGADHAVAPVLDGLGGAGLGIVEARPAGAALELGVRLEQGLAAARAREGAGAFLVVERA